MVIFTVAINSPTTTTTTPARNLLETKNLPGNILAALSMNLGTITMNLVRWPRAISLHVKDGGVNKFGAKWPTPISETTSIQLNFEKPQT